MRVTVKLGDAKDFFLRGRVIARLADAGAVIPNEKIIAFEDKAEIESSSNKTKNNPISKKPV